MNVEQIEQQVPSRTRRRGPVAWAMAAALLIAGSTVWFWPKHKTQATATAIPVSAGHPVIQDFPIRVGSTGTVLALNTVDVKVRVDGQLEKILFNEGQDVKAGQVLAQLDQGPLTAQLHQAQAQQRKDQASLDNASRDLARYSKLVGIGAATPQSVDTARANVESYTAAVAADAAAVQNDQLQLGFTVLRAPFAGRVGMREADVGAIVHPGDTTGIVTVTQMEPITVLFMVPQDVLHDVLAHQATAPLRVDVTSREGGTRLATGQLQFVDSTVDTTTGQIRLKASFANAERTLWPGELVNAQVLIRTDSKRLAVPSRAIVNTQTGTQLYVVDANGTASLRTVRTGAIVDGMTEVRNGVSAADLVVLDGQSRLNPGVRVAATVVATRPAAAAVDNPDNPA